MEEGENFEFRRDAIFGEIHPNEQTGTCEQRHFRVTNLIRLAAGKCKLDRLERSASEHFAKGLDGHIPRLYQANKWGTRGIAGVLSTPNRYNSMHGLEARVTPIVNPSVFLQAEERPPASSV